MKRALITGVTDKDTADLSQILLEKGHEVYNLLADSVVEPRWIRPVLIEQVTFIFEKVTAKMVDGDFARYRDRNA
jgi:GDP-D-mannose dehydratase